MGSITGPETAGRDASPQVAVHSLVTVRCTNRHGQKLRAGAMFAGLELPGQQDAGMGDLFAGLNMSGLEPPDAGLPGAESASGTSFREASADQAPAAPVPQYVRSAPTAPVALLCLVTASSSWSRAAQVSAE